MSRPADPADDRRRRPGAEPDWSEWAHFEWLADDAASGGSVRVTVLPNEGRSVARVVLTGRDRPPAVIIDDDLPLPSPAPTWEIRGPGLWIDLVCEQPLEHWSVGLEAFAVELDEADLEAGRWYGERVAVGLDLGFEDEAPVLRSGGVPGHVAHCRVAGRVLWGADRLEVDGWGFRSRGWSGAPEG